MRNRQVEHKKSPDSPGFRQPVHQLIELDARVGGFIPVYASRAWNMASL